MKFPASKTNDKFQNPNVKGMSKLKVQNLWHWGFGLDLAFGIWALAFDPQGKASAVSGQLVPPKKIVVARFHTSSQD
jgi:hypothetical protein